MDFAATALGLGCAAPEAAAFVLGLFPANFLLNDCDIWVQKPRNFRIRVITVSSTTKQA